MPLFCCCGGGAKNQQPGRGRKYRADRRRSEQVENEQQAAEADAMAQEGMSDLMRLRTMSNAAKAKSPAVSLGETPGESQDSYTTLPGGETGESSDGPKEGYIDVGSSVERLDSFGQPFYESYEGQQLEDDIATMIGMGFLEGDVNRRALLETGGDVEKAVGIVMQIVMEGDPSAAEGEGDGGNPSRASSTASFDFKSPVTTGSDNPFVAEGSETGGADGVAPRRESSEAPPPMLPAKTTPAPAPAPAAPAPGGVIHIEILGTWQATYVGNAVVDGDDNDIFVERAISKIKGAGGDPHADPCHIRVSARTVKVNDARSNTPIDASWVKVISYIAVLDRPEGGNKHFAYISKNVALEFSRCWVYECDEQSATELAQAMSRALKLNVNLPNPFAAPEGQELVRPPTTISGHEIRRHFLSSTGVVGAGQFGEVHLAMMNEKGRGGTDGELTTVAVKLLKMTAAAEDRDEFIRECEAMLALRGADNLCQVHGVSVRRRPWLCIIEFLKYGDANGLLKTCVAKEMVVNLSEFLYMAQQVANGMSFMETKGWIHMDLAARNVLVHSGLVCKVADFGLSRMVDPITLDHVITKQMKLPVKWLAMESMSAKTFSIATDVWAFGVTAWEFFAYGEMPFRGTPNAHVLTFLSEGTRLERKDNCPEKVYELIHRCWMENPADRPSFTELADQLQHHLDESGGVSMCRDIGFELKGGRKRLPSEAASGQLQNTKAARENRHSIMMSEQLQRKAEAPMGFGAALTDAEMALNLNGTQNAKGYINGNMIQSILDQSRTLKFGDARIDCTYQNGRCKYKQDATTQGPYCNLHTCTSCGGPKRSAETMCGNCAIAGSEL